MITYCEILDGQQSIELYWAATHNSGVLKSLEADVFGVFSQLENECVGLAIEIGLM